MKNKTTAILVILLLLTMSAVPAAGSPGSDAGSTFKNISDMPVDLLRSFLRAYWEIWDTGKTDQRKGLPAPPIQKPFPPAAQLIDLYAPEKITLGRVSLFDLIQQRRSRRSFTTAAMSVEELSYLLWATQGITRIVRRSNKKIAYHLRTVPSGGARHPFETYLVINRVKNIPPGLYRYLPVQHKLLPLRKGNLASRAANTCYGAGFVRQAAVVFFWTALPYRTEWRYSFQSAKIIAQDSGHMCQNLYLAAESIGAGTCAVDGYSQEKADRFLEVDGKDELTVYVAPVGKIPIK